MERQTDNASTLSSYARKVWLAAGVAAAVIGLLFLLWYGIGVLLIIFAGLLLGLFLLVPADWLSRHSFLSHRWAMAVMLLALAALIAMFGFIFATSLNEQFQQLLQALPSSLSELKDRIRGWPLGQEFISRLEQGLPQENILGQWYSRISSFLSSTFGFLIDLFFIILIALFFVFEPTTYRSGLLQLVLPARRESAYDLLRFCRHKLNWWMLGRLVSMTVVGVATGIGLWLLGMPMALSLAVLAAVLVFIPNLGPLLAAVPALLIALSQGLVWQVALLYLLIQLVESNLITPVIDRQSVKLPPALLVSTQIGFGLYAGILGLLLAAPLTVVAMVVIKRVYVDGWLEGKDDPGSR